MEGQPIAPLIRNIRCRKSKLWYRPRMRNRPTKSTAPQAVHVVPHGSGWAVSKPDVAGEGNVHPTRSEALRAAEDSLRTQGGKLRVKERGGRWRESFTIGRSGFARISAVEGIHLPGDMEKHLRELDRQGLSPEDRLRAIMCKLGK